MRLKYRDCCSLLVILFAQVCASQAWGADIFVSHHFNLDHGTINKVADDTLLIVAFGNSITAERKTVDQVFAQRLPHLLAQEEVNVKVINSGVGGSHTGRQIDHDLFEIKHGMDRFQNDVMDHRPDLVIIGFGTNDSYIDSKTPNGTSRIPLDAYQANLEYFITNLQAQGSEIILIAPNILGARYGDFQNKRLLKYVKVVRKLSRKHRTGLVDNYNLFQKYAKAKQISYEDLMLDGCHPNDVGHQLIAEHLTIEILKQFKNEK